MSIKKHKYINLLLVLMLSFSMAHSFVIEESHQKIDSHGCVGCVVEVGQDAHSNFEHSHVFNCEFHNPYILSDNTTLLLSEKVTASTSFTPKSYTYYHSNKLIKPPIA